jgi:hypothetical protein
MTEWQKYYIRRECGLKQIIMNSKDCTLTMLYPSVEIRLIIFEKLKEVFKFKFEALLKEVSAFRPLSACPAKYFEKDIRYLFIEEGEQLDKVEDFEIALYKLNFLKFPDYRKAKENFDKSIEVEKNIEEEKRIRFDI